MKNIVNSLICICLIGMSVFLNSCSSNEEGRGETLSSYITGYMTQPTSLFIGDVDSGIKITFKGTVVTGGGVYDSLAESYGDTSYNRYNAVEGPRTAIPGLLKSIKVETVNDFDESHPAGSDISDIMGCTYVSYYDFIQNGYVSTIEKDLDAYSDMGEFLNMSGATLYNVNLVDLVSDETMLLAKTLVLKFYKEPSTTGTHQFNMTIQMRDNTIKTSFEYDFSSED